MNAKEVSDVIKEYRRFIVGRGRKYFAPSPSADLDTLEKSLKFAANIVRRLPESNNPLFVNGNMNCYRNVNRAMRKFYGCAKQTRASSGGLASADGRNTEIAVRRDGEDGDRQKDDPVADGTPVHQGGNLL